MQKKHRRKRRKCRLPAFSAFPQTFFLPGIVKTGKIVEYRVKNFSLIFPISCQNMRKNSNVEIYLPNILQCRKHRSKRRKCWLPAFSPFPITFLHGIVKTGKDIEYRVKKFLTNFSLS